MSKKTVETTTSGLQQAVGRSTLAPLATEEVTELGTYFPKSGGGGEGFEPTEEQLEAMNSGITSAKVEAYDTLPDEDDVKDIISDHFVAGTNVTITDNVDGTQTISSTASGGTSDYSDLTNKPSINNVTLSGNKTTSDLGISEVPTITSSDNGKVLTATYSGGTGSYAWAASSAPTPPTAYTMPTLNTTYVDDESSYTWGGYVVVNNICYINLSLRLFQFDSASLEEVATGLPLPAATQVSGDPLVFTANTEDRYPGYFTVDPMGELSFKKDSDQQAQSTFTRQLYCSYLVDTST